MSKTSFDLLDFQTVAEEEGVSLDDSQLKAIYLKHRMEERRSKGRYAFWLKLLTPLVMAVAAAIGGYQVYAPAEEVAAAATEAGQVEAVVEAKEIQKATHVNSQKIEKLGVIAIDQQEQLVESVTYISKKIDAVHPGRADDVPEPPSLKKARATVEDRKKKAAAGQLLEIDTGP